MLRRGEEPARRLVITPDSLLLVIGMFWRKHQSHQRREHGEDIAID
jgi:hypothetical protein